MALVVKNPPANAGDTRDAGLIPGSGRSSGGGHGNPLHYSLPGEFHRQRNSGRLQCMGVTEESDMTEHAPNYNANYNLKGYLRSSASVVVVLLI